MRGLALAGLLALGACGKAPEPRLPAAAVGQEAPELKLPDLTGKEILLSSFRGKVVLLDFWATWCDPCREELPDLISLHQGFQGLGFSVVGVAMDADGQPVVAPFVKKHRVPYPTLLSEGLSVPGYRIFGIPLALLLDRDGVVLKEYLGPKALAEVKRDVKAALALPQKEPSSRAARSGS